MGLKVISTLIGVISIVTLIITLITKSPDPKLRMVSPTLTTATLPWSFFAGQSNRRLSKHVFDGGLMGCWA